MANATAEAWVHYRKRLDELEIESRRVGFRSVVSHIRIVRIQPGDAPIPNKEMIGWLFGELGKRIREEMEHPSVSLNANR